MSDEIREEINEEYRCNCDKKELKRFLLTILGSFLGCLVALCLYGAVVKPQPPAPKMPCPCGVHKMQRGECPKFDHNREARPDFHRIKHQKHDKNFSPIPNQPTPPSRPETK